MLSRTNTKDYYYKVIMLLRRLKCNVFYDEIVKILQYAYWNDIPFTTLQEGINHYLKHNDSKVKRRYRHFSGREIYNRSIVVSFTYDEWFNLFPTQRRKMTKKLIRSLIDKKIEVEILVYKEVDFGLFQRGADRVWEAVKNTWMVKSRLTTDFVKKNIPNKKRFNPSMEKKGRQLLQYLYKHKRII